MVRVFATILALAALAGANAQQISVVSSTDTTDYLVGDPIEFEILVRHDESFTITPPRFPDTLEGVEAIDVAPPAKDAKSQPNETVFRYTLMGFDSIEVVVPPIELYYSSDDDHKLRTLQTEPTRFVVHTLEVKGEEPKDVKAPTRIPTPWWVYALWIGVPIALAAIGYLLYMRLKKRAAIAPAPKKKEPPYWEVALDKLRQLEAKELWQNGEVKAFHSEITEIVRRYLSQRFGLPVMETTTTETVELLANARDAERVLPDVKEFLSLADMVKFAKYAPHAEANAEMTRRAYRIVDTTKPAPTQARRDEKREDGDVS
jgi:hypothetical protein